ncbi:hypothetical protein PC129_g18258 [Phytophthora cactorum]|uniref:Reverse transcriptase Ty1/copia-type domain-containing protein n=1 Tax=Phytophthora cactorum TaxID=29920 RepID=A0A329S2F3_9STRA|nr:hypothetical protein Pcac1_g19011 [Phytophthora cactorum]KAG2810700.1 hypothetical protein PC112_g15941 [Phytophthora cactorum]KAG2823350.1 hypothetical protein PC111_g10259 [Phytophthora cactorum]KAG2855892.1 hypothetical protein PC113_g12061 [Phytophthora cactorum]KAG2878095.1 hypothetical protein PC114_g23293 [Phytophthora cactorum]
MVNALQDPLTLQESMTHPDAEQECQAINAELDSLRHNSTYEEMYLPANVCPVQTKWVFRRKTLAYESLEK